MRSLFKQLNKIALAMVLVIMLQMLIVPQMSLAYGSDRENILTSSGNSSGKMGLDNCINIFGFEHCYYYMVEIYPDPPIVTEPEGLNYTQLYFWVNFDPQLANDPRFQEARVQYNLEGLEGATLDEDYSCESSCRGTLIFNRRETKRSVIVNVKNDHAFEDDFYEDDETLRLTLFDFDPGHLGTYPSTLRQSATATIRHRYTFNIDPAFEVEEGGESVIPITLDRYPSSPIEQVTVDYRISDSHSGLKPDPTEYSVSTEFRASDEKPDRLYFEDGSTIQKIRVTAIDDNEFEQKEDFEVILYNPQGADLNTESATVSIINMTPLRQLKVEANPPIVTEPENGTEIQLPFDVSFYGQEGDHRRIITVDYAIEGGDGLYGATLNEDYSCENSCNGTLTFSYHELQHSVIVNVIGDDVYEENPETLRLTLSNPKPLGHIAENLSEMSAIAFIRENGGRPMPYITSSIEGVEGEQISMEVGLTNAINREIEIGYSTDDGDAQAGEDFTDIPPQQYSLQFQPGETSKKISVETIDDDLPEDDEIFYVILSDIQGVGVTVPRTRVKILDNDSGQNPEFHPTVNVRGSSAVENTRSGKVEFILYLNAPVDEEVTVNYTTLDGTAHAGSDYTRKSGQCIVGKGALECSVEVELINDSNEEGDEFFYLEVLDSNSSSVVVFDDTKALAEIKDDDD